MAVSLATLLVQQTKDAIYTTALNVANAIGLPVSSWQAGDPTRSLFHLEAETLSTLEVVVANFIAAGFLDYATGVWLEILAMQVFNVTVPPATFATADVVLTNVGGSVADPQPGDITIKSSISGKTYRNTTAGHLSAGSALTPTTLTLTFAADEAGSPSSAGAGELNTLVTGLIGVSCANALAAVGVDKQDEPTTRQQCRDKLGSLSPNGPKDAYAFVSRNALLTLTSAITRVRVYPDSTTGNVTTYLAGPSGPVAEADRALVDTAIQKWATPLCITPTTISCAALAVPVTYQLWIYKSCNKTAAQIQADVQTALLAMLAAQPIGGDIIPPATTGILSASLIESTIRATNAKIFKCVVSLPAADASMTNAQVAALGTVTPTITIVVDPT